MEIIGHSFLSELKILRVETIHLLFSSPNPELSNRPEIVFPEGGKKCNYLVDKNING